MKHQIDICISIVAMAAGLALAGQGRTVAQAAGNSADVMVPKFEVDPLWPKPLPNHWILGMTVGVAVDANDDVWIVHRPQTLDQRESLLTRNEGDCCTAAPDVLEFDPAGNLIRHWGKAEGHDWPSSNHGITVDSEGNVWLGGNGPAQPGPPAGTAAQLAVPCCTPPQRLMPSVPTLFTTTVSFSNSARTENSSAKSDVLTGAREILIRKMWEAWPRSGSFRGRAS